MASNDFTDDHQDETEQPDRLAEIVVLLDDEAQADALTLDELTALEGELRAIFGQLQAEGTDEALARAQELRSALSDVQTRRVASEEEHARTAAAFEEIAAELGMDEAEATDDTETEEQEIDADAEPEPLPADSEPVPVSAGTAAASAVTAAAAARTAPLPRRVPAQARQVPLPQPLALGASAKVSVLGQRKPPGSMRDIFEALVATDKNLGASELAVSQKVAVCHAEWEHPADQRFALRASAAENTAVLDRHLSFDALLARRRAITAAGAVFPTDPMGGSGPTGGPLNFSGNTICGPLDVDYTIPVLGNDSRPFRDSLPSIGAPRGGLVWQTSPTLMNDIPADSYGVWTTDDQDAVDADDTATWKTCAVIDCGDVEHAELEAMYRCVELNNFMYRYSMDRADAIMSLIRVAQARDAEQRLLMAVAAGSTPVTWTGVLGATREYLHMLDVATMRYRRRHRIPTVTLVHAMPDWLHELMRADIANAMPGAGVNENLAVADATIDGWFRTRNVRPVYFIDGENAVQTAAQSQSAGALLDFPSHVISYLFAEGTWVMLDGGTLDLGVVRDAALIQQNKLKIFAETFETVIKRLPESLKITATVCPSGGVSGTVDPADVCATVS